MRSGNRRKGEMMRHKDFVAFILTHGRANKVDTIKSLRRHGYTGRVVYVIDDEDEQGDEYRRRFGEEDVVSFSKEEIVKAFDEGDNFGDRRAIIYARNACFGIAKELGYRYFIELDDDYVDFNYRFNSLSQVKCKGIKDLDKVLDMMLDFYERVPQCASLAMSQGGDWIGGAQGTFGREVALHRKAMNSFICSTDRPFTFVGRVNEDVNTYTSKGFVGMLFLTIPQVCLNQRQTQSNAGGMTEMYLDSGTYVKSFYSVMYHPSGVKIGQMRNKNKRIHHLVQWENTVPKIMSEKYVK